MVESPAFYVTKVVESGRPRMLKRALGMALLAAKEQDNGQFAVIGNRLMHLCGWTPCHVTAKLMAAAIEGEDIAGGQRTGGIVVVLSWPCDVSAWPSAAFKDAPGRMHLPPDAMKELRYASH